MTSEIITLQTDDLASQLSKARNEEALNVLAGKALGLKIEGLDDKAGVEMMRAARKELRETRLAIETRRKEIKAPLLEFNKSVDAEAKRLTALLQPAEAHAKAEMDRFESLKKAAKEAEIARKKARLDNRMAKLAAYGSQMPPSEVDELTDEAFEEALFDAEQAWKRAEKERLAKEAEEKRIREEQEAAAERARQEEAKRREGEELKRAELEAENARMKERLEALEAAQTASAGIPAETMREHLEPTEAEVEAADDLERDQALQEADDAPEAPAPAVPGEFLLHPTLRGYAGLHDLAEDCARHLDRADRAPGNYTPRAVLMVEELAQALSNGRLA